MEKLIALQRERQPHYLSMKEWDKEVLKVWREINAFRAELGELMDAIENYLDEYNMDLNEATDYACSDYGISICSLVRDAIYYNAKITLM